MQPKIRMKSSKYRTHFFCRFCSTWVRKGDIGRVNPAPRCPKCNHLLRTGPKQRYGKRARELEERAFFEAQRLIERYKEHERSMREIEEELKALCRLHPRLRVDFDAGKVDRIESPDD